MEIFNIGDFVYYTPPGYYGNLEDRPQYIVISPEDEEGYIAIIDILEDPHNQVEKTIEYVGDLTKVL